VETIHWSSDHRFEDRAAPKLAVFDLLACERELVSRAELEVRAGAQQPGCQPHAQIRARKVTVSPVSSAVECGMRFSRSMLVLVSLLAGCGEGEEDRFAPVQGQWNLVLGAHEINTCSDEPGTSYEGTITLLLAEDGFTVTSSGEEYVCTLSDHDFMCEHSSSQAIGGIDDATYFYQGVWNGSFVTDSIMTGEMTWNVDCEGEGCSAVGWTSPCYTLRSLSAEKA
jgi:hypothetical protein